MLRPSDRRRASTGIALVAIVALLAVLTIPALAADPTAAPSASGLTVASIAPDATRAPKPDKPPKVAKSPEVEVTLTGVVGTRTGPDGRPEFTITVGSTVHPLDVGPAWYWGDANPLRSYVGKRVTVVGEHRTGATEVEVRTVDGVAVREPGKPPWAGGWKRVGERHPGWTKEKWDRWQAKREDKMTRSGGDCWPPGHCKAPGGPASSVAPRS
jgi:hypothetical protein